MRMTKTALKALKQSIAHWMRLASGKSKQNEDTGRSDCALCAQFNRVDQPHLTDCAGCPIFKYTGRQYCAGTPFEVADDMRDEYGLLSPEFADAAENELAFLKSLLPKNRGRKSAK
jgi:hypothetical protein